MAGRIKRGGMPRASKEARIRFWRCAVVYDADWQISWSGSKDMASIVYVLTNEGMPGLLKIGTTDLDDPRQRMSQLYTTGVPFPFECVKAVEVADADLEKALHTAFGPHRVNPGREFFRMAEEHVLAILDIWPGARDVTRLARQEVGAGTGVQEREAIKQAKKRRPNLDFRSLGIPPGERLVFDERFGESTKILEALVKTNQKVEFRGEEMSLTKATLRALGKPDGSPIRPAPYWSYNGRSLYDLYEELYQQAR